MERKADLIRREGYVRNRLERLYYLFKDVPKDEIDLTKAYDLIDDMTTAMHGSHFLTVKWQKFEDDKRAEREKKALGKYDTDSWYNKYDTEEVKP